MTNKIGTVDLIVISSGIGFENPTLNLNKDLQTIQTNVLGFTAVAEWAYSLFTKQKKGI